MSLPYEIEKLRKDNADAYELGFSIRIGLDGFATASCPKCKALVWAMDAKEHYKWHKTIKKIKR